MGRIYDICNIPYQFVKDKMIGCTTRIRMFIIRHKNKEKRIFLMGIPDHHNLGDQAIAYAEKKFLQDYFPTMTIVEITFIQWKEATKAVISCVQEKDLILLHGGGYLGDLWPGVERVTRDIIDSFPLNFKIMMPNTIFFKDNVTSTKLREYREYYSGLSNFYMFLRDKNSYDFVLKNIMNDKNKCFLFPDTVAYLEINSPDIKRKGVLFCLRNDLEKIRDDGEVDNLKQELEKRGVDVKYTDTCLKHGVRPWQRVSRLNKKWEEFQHTGLVVTDRLHGMYFAAITGTPCIAINNISSKVEGGYNWLMNLTYVKYFKEGLRVNDALEMMKQGAGNYSNTELKKQYFNAEAQTIGEIMQNTCYERRRA